MRTVLFLFGICYLTGQLHADTISLGGTITQSLADSGETAINNPALNNIVDGDTFQVLMNFSGAVGGPGNASLTSVEFEDTTVSAIENGFISGTLAIDSAPPDYQLFVVACLTTQPDCGQGNELLLSFQIPISGLNLAGVTAGTIANLSPSLDLLEDDGNTEIQGSITQYTYRTSGPAQAPEPSTFALFAGAAALLAVRARNHSKK